MTNSAQLNSIKSLQLASCFKEINYSKLSDCYRGVYGKVKSLYFLGITPSLNLIVVILLSCALMHFSVISLVFASCMP
jgi:hypothetical protein